ncbi:MAG TPA: cytochrome d ubiquinol oxidase subunit II [Longilinea sp.]|nr:cytochrome d ubiquinol oxidase subunit II [Longilinea sp.]
MDFYQVLWFILIAVLWTGYFVLEGFDMGVGILLPFIAKDDKSRRMVINTIGPHWDGNEVWLITAGGATFAAFPNWYATLFSGFYLPLLLILLALIVRGVAFEFRSRDENPLWRSFWDWAIFVGSAIPALLWGVAFANFLRGVPIDANMQYVGGFFNLLNPYAILGGVASFGIFTLLGALFLSMKTVDPIEGKAKNVFRGLWVTMVAVLAVFVAASALFTDGNGSLGWLALILAVLGGITLLTAGVLAARGRFGWGFILTSVTVLLVTIAAFARLFPRVLVSNIDPGYSLTIMNSASGPNTLHTMTIVAAVMVPIVLAYQVWSYYLLRKRVTGKPESLHY